MRVVGRRPAWALAVLGLAIGCLALTAMAAGRSAVAGEDGTGQTATRPAGPARRAPLVVHPAADDRVLLVNQASAAFPVGSDAKGRQVEMLLRHFTPQTRRITDAAYAAGELERYDRIVLVGNDPGAPWPDALLADVRSAQRPVLWLGYGLGQLGGDLDASLGFSPGFALEAPGPVELAYRDARIDVTLEELPDVRISHPRVSIVASFLRDGREYPYIVRSGDLWYASVLPALDTLYPTPELDAPTLVLADVMHDFFETGIEEGRAAVIRLEDVSVNIDPGRLRETVDFLAAEDVPYVLGLIPAQRYPDGSIVPIGERPELVAVLREAQESGGTIALHGYHHTFGSGEDFEFWDPDRHAAPVGEAGAPEAFRDLYRFKMADGIRILRDQGIEPRLWETPHYAGSPLAYGVFGEVFSHAIENRDPATWLPFVAGPDDAGQILVPENIGYIAPSGGWTVEAQLERAGLLRLVRDATVVGFYHPGAIPLDELRRLVAGLRQLGYGFGDVSSLPLEVRSRYRPDQLTQTMTTISVDRLVMADRLELAVASVVPAWETVRSIPWPLLVGAGLAGLFLLRLPLQWRTDPTESTLVESTPPIRRRRLVPASVGLVAVLAMALTGLAGLAAPGPGRPPAEAAVRGSGTTEPSTPSIGRSSLPAAWTGATDGWELSTYFTPVETYYGGAPTAVVGCTELECTHGQELLGRFPADFVRTVREEGTGRITSPSVRPEATHLNWSINVGYWLDTAIRDARGAVLEAYVSVAADPAIPYVTAVSVLACGRDAVEPEVIPAAVCDRIRTADWVVGDRFTAGAVGKHLDLYIGEQDQRDFIALSPRAIHVLEASVRLTPYTGTARP